MKTEKGDYYIIKKKITSSDIILSLKKILEMNLVKNSLEKVNEMG